MADENKPTPQQSQDAVQLDSLTSLQQTTEGDQGGTVGTTDVRADYVTTPANSNPQDGPSFYLPNTDLTNAPPAQTGGAPTSDSETEAANSPKDVGETIDPVTGALVLGVTVADTPEVQGAIADSGEGERSANNSIPLGPGASNPMNAPRVGTLQAQEEVAVESAGSAAATEPLPPTTTTEAIQQAVVPQVSDGVVTDATAPAVSTSPAVNAPFFVPDSVATLTSDTKALTESDAVLSTSGTLTLADADATAATVTAQTDTAGTYGKFSIGTNSAWTYTTNDAVNQLNAGQVVTETFTVATSDGGSATVTVTLTGTNDVATLTSDTKALTESDAVLSTSGTLTLADADATAATVTAQTDTAGTYGKFSIGTNGAWTYTTNDAVNQLNAGQVVTETFTVATSDGGSATVTVTLTGTNDVATLTSDTKALTESDAVLSTSGTLTLADADATAATVTAQTDTAGTYGKFSIGTNGAWTYTTNDAVNQLNAGQVVTETFTVATSDGGSATVTVTLTGTNDVATLTSDTKALTESDAVLSTSGTLTLADADATAATVTAQTDTAGTYGKFSIGTNGAWTYTTNDAVNQLNAGQVVTETFTVATSDGGSATVTVTLTGTNDVATLTSDTKALTESDAVLSTSGTLTLADADATAATVTAQTETAGTYGQFSIGTNGAWTYTTNDAVNQLNAGQVVTETFTVATSDGGSATVTVTLTGTNDVATLTSDTKALTESDAVLSTSGTLTLADADATAATVTAQTETAGTYGQFSIGTNGAWTYTTNDAVNQLNAGQVVTETFTVATSDGGSATVTVTLTGTNDVATLTSDTKALTESDAVLSTSGTLTLADADATAATVTAQTETAGTYGQFSIGTNGAWTYTTNDAVNQLNAGQVVTETFTVATSDGGSATVTVTLTGTNDVATIAGTTQGNVTEIGGINNATPGVPTASGQLTSDDVDNPINTFQSSSGSASYGTYSINASGAWTYSLNNSDTNVNALNAGESLSDSFVVMSADGTPQTITVLIQGSTDYVTITGTNAVDTLTGTAANEVITGGLLGDTLTGNAGLDIFVVSSGVTFGGNNTNPTVTGYDKVTDFVSGSDQIQLPVNIVVAANTAIVNGTDTAYRYSTTAATIKAHSISNGVVSFYNANTGGTAITIDSAKAVASAVKYLTLNDLGNAGTTVSFSTTMTQVVGGTTLYTHYIYQQPTTAAGNTSATVVEVRVPTTSFTLDVTPGTKLLNPIALDLNQDGVTYIDRSQGVTYDYANDGSAVSTAWVDSSDGMLAVQTEDGKLNIVFSTQDGETDLEGLAKVYDSKQDGVFDASDEHFGKFGVWQDANSDGIVQAGEFKTLDQAGITSLSLESSGEQHVTANGDIVVYGQSTFTTKDGVTFILEDAGFATTVGTQMIGGVSNIEPALIATVASTTEGQESLLGYSVIATLDHVEANVGDAISLVINDGAITISHTLTADDIADRRYEFRMSESVIVTDVTNVVGVHLGLVDATISSYFNPISIPYTLLAAAAYDEGLLTNETVLQPDQASQPLQFSVMMSEVLVEDNAEAAALEPADFVVSNGIVSSVTIENSTHCTLEVVSDGRAPLSEVSLQVAQPVVPVLENPQSLTEIDNLTTLDPVTPDSTDFMLLELGGVTYVIDTSVANASETSATDDYVLTNSLSAPLVAGSWTEVVSGTEISAEPLEPIEPVNPLTDTSAPPMINTEILDDPRLTDNGSWTP